MAQLAPTDATTATDAAPADIIVTATRVNRQGYSAPTPTTFVNRTQIEAAAPANIADLVNQLPALAGSTNPRGQGLGSGNTSGANFLNLRNLGTSRTLVLLDGKRLPPSVITGAVDVNVLPQGLIEGVEVVTGGASAGWGSDAVAGVVNFRLKRDFTGLRLEGQTGITQAGDSENFQVSLTAGTSFAGGRGQIMAYGQWSEVGVGARAGLRDWYRGHKVIGNPALTPTNGAPQFAVLPDIGTGVGTRGGLVVAGPLRGTQFVGPNGSPAPFDFGFASGQLSTSPDAEDLGAGAPLQQPLVNRNAFARASFDITDNVTLASEFIYGYSQAESESVPYFRFSNVTIRNDNAFLNAAIRAQMAAARLTSINIGTTNENLGNSIFTLTRELIAGNVGLNGSFGNGWTWNLFYQHGITNFEQNAGNNAIVANYNLAVDAVVNPANGQIVCRSTLTNPTNGCVPLNVLGVTTPSDAARAYVLGNSNQPIRFTQDFATATLRGDPFSTWAGPVSAAVGVEYRREDYNATADALSVSRAFFLGNYQLSSGTFDVKEGFAEAVVPVLRDVPLLKSLDLNLAWRISDYSTSGTVNTWKVGATWDVVDDLRLRVTRSRDIRAGNLGELFRAAAFAQSNIFDPTNGVTAPAVTVTTGNRGVEPEKADTLAAGFVYQPGWLSGFSMSVDYYDIKIDNAIFTPSAAITVNECAIGNQRLCANITRGANGIISEVLVRAENVTSERASGIDAEFSYRSAIGSGMLNLRGLVSWVRERTINAFGSNLVFDGTNGDLTAVPRWRANLTANWRQGPTSVNVTSRLISAGELSKQMSIADSRVPAIAYFDLSLAQRVKTGGADAELFFVVENLLDKDPPVAPATSAANTLIATGSNGYVYDLLGRQFRAGFRVKF
jgi:iron complex outermembrane recepter protein